MRSIERPSADRTPAAKPQQRKEVDSVGGIPYTGAAFGSTPPCRPTLENPIRWKRDDAPRPAVPPATPTTPQTPAPPPSAVEQPAVPRSAGVPERSAMSMGNIGKSVVIKGELNGSEDLTIEGQVEGKIELKDNVLTIGTNGKIKASVFAKTVIVLGEVVGNVTASEK